MSFSKITSPPPPFFSSPLPAFFSPAFGNICNPGQGARGSVRGKIFKNNHNKNSHPVNRRKRALAGAAVCSSEEEERSIPRQTAEDPRRSDICYTEGGGRNARRHRGAALFLPFMLNPRLKRGRLAHEAGRGSWKEEVKLSLRISVAASAARL